MLRLVLASGLTSESASSSGLGISLLIIVCPYKFIRAFFYYIALVSCYRPTEAIFIPAKINILPTKRSMNFMMAGLIPTVIDLSPK